MTKFVNFIGGNSPVSLPGQQPSQSRTLPTDKQVLTWNTALEIWEPSTIVFALDDLSDVNIPTPVANQHIIWDSGTNKFIQSDTALKASEAAKVTGVDASGNFTYYGKDAGGSVGFHAVPVIKTDFNSLSDVNIPTPVDKQLVKWDSGTSMWIQVAQSAVNTTFDDTPVTFTAADVQAAIEALDAKAETIIAKAEMWYAKCPFTDAETYTTTGFQHLIFKTAGEINNNSSAVFSATNFAAVDEGFYDVHVHVAFNSSTYDNTDGALILTTQAGLLIGDFTEANILANAHLEETSTNTLTAANISWSGFLPASTTLYVAYFMKALGTATTRSVPWQGNASIKFNGNN